MSTDPLYNFAVWWGSLGTPVALPGAPQPPLVFDISFFSVVCLKLSLHSTATSPPSIPPSHAKFLLCSSSVHDHGENVVFHHGHLSMPWVSAYPWSHRLLPSTLPPPFRHPSATLPLSLHHVWVWPHPPLLCASHRHPPNVCGHHNLPFHPCLPPFCHPRCTMFPPSLWFCAGVYMVLVGHTQSSATLVLGQPCGWSCCSSVCTLVCVWCLNPFPALG